MDFTLNDRAINFELDNRNLDFRLNDAPINFKLNALVVHPPCFRLLQDGFRRLLETGSYRLLEDCDGVAPTVDSLDYVLDFIL